MAILAALPVLTVVNNKQDTGSILIFALWELIILLLTTLIVASHTKLYLDRIENGAWPFKYTILLKEIKKLDMKLVDYTIRGKTTQLLSIIFLDSDDNTLMTISLKSMSRPEEFISIIKNNSNNIILSKNLIDHLDENINYEKYNVN